MQADLPPRHASARFSSLSAGACDYIAGTVSGIGKVLAGYPFDFVKGRVQSGLYANSMTAVRHTLKNEGPLAFYQGAATPAVTVCAVGGVVFYVNGTVKRWFDQNRAKSSSRVCQGENVSSVTLGEDVFEHFVAGCCGGLAVGILLNPMEVVKLRMQVAQRRTTSSHNRLLDVQAKNKSARHLFIATARSLSLRQWLTAWHLTLFREVCTFGLFFPANAYFRSIFTTNTSSGETVSVPVRILAAGCAGVVCWLPCFPVDVVKSRMQSGLLLKEEPSSSASHSSPSSSAEGSRRRRVSAPQQQSARAVAQDLYAREGFRGFSRGIAPCLMRAFPAYAAQYYLFEFMAKRVLTTSQ